MKPLYRNALAITLIIVALIYTGCASKRLTAGSYAINKTRSASVKPAVVYGSVYEYGTQLPAIVPRVYVGQKLKAKADPRSGKYAFFIEPGKYRFTGQAMSFYSTKTSKTKVSIGDSVRIDFYLRVNETPLID